MMRSLPREVGGLTFRTHPWLGGGTIPPDTSLLFGAVFGDPTPISFGERAPESSGFKIPTVSRRSGLLPPGVVQITTVERVEAKFVDKAKHCCLGVQRIADDRESYPLRRSLRDGLHGDRDDDDFSGFSGADNRNGRRADLGRQRGQTLRSSRVCNRDPMSELGKAACKCPSYVSSADDSDPHMPSSFSNLISTEN